jgi:hypothetical protein
LIFFIMIIIVKKLLVLLYDKYTLSDEIRILCILTHPKQQACYAVSPTSSNTRLPSLFPSLQSPSATPRIVPAYH